MNEPRNTVAVIPAESRDKCKRLFDALEAALPVRFQGRRPAELRGTDGVVVLPGPEGASPNLEELERSALVASAPEPAPGGSPAQFELAQSNTLDPRIRGQRFGDPAARTAKAVTHQSGDDLLGTCDGVPVWVARRNRGLRRTAVAFAPAELRPNEALRNRLQDGRSLALLPLLHFLRELTAEIDFRPPPLRATFVLDDPNLHWPTYGNLDFRAIARHADDHEYHVAMAMVPLDGWLAHPGAVRLFRERADRLSLLVHGNNHVLQELARPRPRESGRALLAQAVRRVVTFERRTGLRVARVMAPPHGDCSEQMARDMLLFGFEALCIGRPYPWAAREPHSWLTRPSGTSPLAAFSPSTLVAGGLPVMLRQPFAVPPGDLALRAFLDQPLILYGHHQDIEGGPGLFGSWADQLRAIGSVRWTSPAEIASTNHATRLDGDLLRVRMHGRRANVEVPEGAERLRIELPAGHEGHMERVLCAKTASVPGDDIPLPPRVRGWRSGSCAKMLSTSSRFLLLPGIPGRWRAASPARDAIGSRRCFAGAHHGLHRAGRRK